MTRTSSTGLLPLLALLAAVAATPAHAADAGVVGTRLAITSNASNGKSTLASTQRGAGVSFGPASAASELSGSLEVYYVDTPTNRIVLPLPSPWDKVDARTAKFLNKFAPAGPTGVRTATVRAGTMAKVAAKTAGGLDLTQPPGPGGVMSILTVHNAGDGSTHRMCSLYRVSSGSKIAHRSVKGRSRLTLTKGVPVECPRCDDGVRNDLETGVDCGGGLCAACGVGEGCAQNSDCATGLCSGGVCAFPACTGGVKDGSETGIDCGGPVCPKCGAGQGCNGPSDCESGVCTDNVCQAPTCGDGVENGDETDVDCGGSCGACVPFTVTIDTPVHGAFSQASSVTVTGHTTGVGPAGADLTINDVAVPLAPDGTFTTNVPLFPEIVFNPIAARLVRRFDGLTVHDRVVVVAGASVADGDASPNGVALRINDRGFDSIEPVATTLVEIDPATLVPAGTKVMEDYCYAPLGSLCLGSVDVTISGTPPPSIGPIGIAIDSQTGSLDGDISLEDLRVTVNIDSASGIPIHCELAITVGLTQIFGDYGLSPLAGQPTRVDVQQIGNVVVQASDTTHITDCSGLFGDLTESLIGSAIGDVGALFANGMQDFLNTVDASGNTPIAGAIETALAGVDIAGPVGSGLGIDLYAPFTSIDEDPVGITFAADVAATATPVPGAPDLTASYHVDESFPTFGATTPVQNLPYGIGLGISTSGFNQLLRAQIETGLLRTRIHEIDLGGGPIPLSAALLGALLTPFSQLPPTTPIAIRVSPTLAPVLTGASGPNGELGELAVAHVLVEFVQDESLPSEQVHLVLAVDARLGLQLAFQPGGIGFALSPPTAADVAVSLLRNPLGVSEVALQGFLPSVLAGFLPDLASALQSFPLPSFLGLSLSGVEVSRTGAYYAIFADLTPDCVDGSVCPSGVCLDGACQAPTCTDGVANGAETDVDCGGGSCPGCATGEQCFLSTDCATGGCSGGVCQPTCTSGAECPSGVCEDGFCRVANCADGVKNGSESGIDCGGSSPFCVRCADGQTCNTASDCASGICSGGVCQAPSCSDGLQNGSETDVDCGGSCPPCALTKKCTVGSDCASGVCGQNARCTCGNRSFVFDVTSSTGGPFSSAEWPGGTATQSSSPGCSVTINRPNDNIDLVCTLAAPFSVQTFSGFSQCFGAGGEDGDGCEPVSCPFAGIGSCCSGRPSCSVGLNGSAQARYRVTCLE
ncbi:MAG TPA: hypothetical protein VIS07_07465 [Candidatus Binatia bacterium]